MPVHVSGVTPHLQEALQVAVWCNCVRSMCVDCVQVAVHTDPSLMLAYLHKLNWAPVSTKNFNFSFTSLSAFSVTVFEVAVAWLCTAHRYCRGPTGLLPWTLGPFSELIFFYSEPSVIVHALCVGCVLTACRLRSTTICTQSTHILRTRLHQTAAVQSLLKIGE
jgi:hypothetical protein